MLKDQEYVLSKIRFYQAEKSNLSSTFLDKIAKVREMPRDGYS
jgi:hypothetical protein